MKIKNVISLLLAAVITASSIPMIAATTVSAASTPEALDVTATVTGSGSATEYGVDSNVDEFLTGYLSLAGRTHNEDAMQFVYDFKYDTAYRVSFDARASVWSKNRYYLIAGYPGNGEDNTKKFPDFEFEALLYPTNFSKRQFAVEFTTPAKPAGAEGDTFEGVFALWTIESSGKVRTQPFDIDEFIVQENGTQIVRYNFKEFVDGEIVASNVADGYDGGYFTVGNKDTLDSSLTSASLVMTVNGDVKYTNIAGTEGTATTASVKFTSDTVTEVKTGKYIVSAKLRHHYGESATPAAYVGATNVGATVMNGEASLTSESITYVIDGWTDYVAEFELLEAASLSDICVNFVSKGSEAYPVNAYKSLDVKSVKLVLVEEYDEARVNEVLTQKVIDLIDAIGRVNEKSGAAIAEAEAAYANLSDELKSGVVNYAELVEARATYDALSLDNGGSLSAGTVMMILFKKRVNEGANSGDVVGEDNVIVSTGNYFEGALAEDALAKWTAPAQTIEAGKLEDGTDYIAVRDIKNNNTPITFATGNNIPAGSYHFKLDLRTADEGEESQLRLNVCGQNKSVRIDNAWTTLEFLLTVTDPTELSIGIYGGPLAFYTQNYDIANLSLTALGDGVSTIRIGGNKYAAGDFADKELALASWVGETNADLGWEGQTFEHKTDKDGSNYITISNRSANYQTFTLNTGVKVSEGTTYEISYKVRTSEVTEKGTQLRALAGATADKAYKLKVEGEGEEDPTSSSYHAVKATEQWKTMTALYVAEADGELGIEFCGGTSTKHIHNIDIGGFEVYEVYAG